MLLLQRHKSPSIPNSPDWDEMEWMDGMDGRMDESDSSRVNSQDLVFCRRHRGLEKRIANEADKDLKAKVQYWAGAWEAEEYFQQL